MSSRVEYIDIARGIGIALVVIGHNQVCDEGGMLYSLIFCFHMPLFFFISGCFHRTKKSLVTEIISRGKRLLLPYYVTAFAFILFKTCMNPAGFYHNELRPILFGVLWGSGGTGSTERYLFWPPLWFLTAMFVTQVAYSIILRIGLFEKSMLSRVSLYTLVLIFGYFYLESNGSGYVNVFGAKMILSENGYPFNVDLVPVTIFFYWIGAEVNQIIKLPNIINSVRVCGGVLMFSVIIFIAIHWWMYCRGNIGVGMDLNLRRYGHFFVTTVLAIVGILNVLVLSLIIDIKIRGSFVCLLKILGRYSLSILVFHYFIQKQAAEILQNYNLWPIGYALGLVAPILIARFIISRNRILYSIYGGVPVAR